MRAAMTATATTAMVIFCFRLKLSKSRFTSAFF
jgi:hypothetical protein